MGDTTLTGKEIVQVYGSSQLMTTKDIANLSASYIQTQVVISGGNTYNAEGTSTFVGWNSAMASPKTTVIPTSTGSLEEIIISDIFGSAATYPITATPISGNIIGVNEVYTGNGSITLLDTIAGWVSI